MANLESKFNGLMPLCVELNSAWTIQLYSDEKLKNILIISSHDVHIRFQLQMIFLKLQPTKSCGHHKPNHCRLQKAFEGIKNP